MQEQYLINGGSLCCTHVHVTPKLRCRVVRTAWVQARFDLERLQKSESYVNYDEQEVQAVKACSPVLW